jgi:hypothetical protein
VQAQRRGGEAVTALQGLFAILLVVALVALSIGWHYSRSNALLHKWADENDFQLLGREYRNFFKGPFLWTTARGQTVYRVTVRDRRGNTRTGWVRCGSWLFGLLSDKAEVRWDN